jgi:hypothetical protein
MKNKIYTFGFLAAALIISPGAALAQQGQTADQNMNQNVVVSGSGNSVNTSGTQITHQRQRKTGYGYCRQTQNSAQNLGQNVGVFGHNNRVNIDATQKTIQEQMARRGC